jgi:hypothetical protein
MKCNICGEDYLYPTLHICKPKELGAPLPKPPEVATLRDQFAAQLPSDSVRDILYNCLSRRAQEILVGVTHPLKEDFEGGVDYQLAELDFVCRVNAAIRFKLADAMMKERNAHGDS